MIDLNKYTKQSRDANGQQKKKSSVLPSTVEIVENYQNIQIYIHHKYQESRMRKKNHFKQLKEKKSESFYITS